MLITNNQIGKSRSVGTVTFLGAQCVYTFVIVIAFLSYYSYVILQPGLPVALNKITVHNGGDKDWHCSYWYQNIKLGKMGH